MTLSVQKLEKLLSSHGFLVQKFFTNHSECVYIEVFSIVSANSFMLYIPAKYKIKAPEAGANVFRLLPLEISEDGYIPTDYAGEPDEIDLEEQYDEVEMSMTPDNKQNSLAENLEESYNQPITLKDISKVDKKILQEIFRQLRRLKLCVQNIKYKICIVYKNYLCCVNRHNTFEAFNIDKFREGMDELQMYITLDLETLYAKIDTVNGDIELVRQSIYRVMDKNQNNHLRHIRRLFEQNLELDAISSKISDQKQMYVSGLTKFTTLLQHLLASEKKLTKDLNDIERRALSGGGLQGMHDDISRTHAQTRLRKELEELYNVKKDLIGNIKSLRTKYENMTLKLDNTMFDCSVMFHTLAKNIKFLKEI